MRIMTKTEQNECLYKLKTIRENIDELNSKANKDDLNELLRYNGDMAEVLSDIAYIIAGVKGILIIAPECAHLEEVIK